MAEGGAIDVEMPMMMEMAMDSPAMMGSASAAPSPSAAAAPILRKEFPETWMWDDIVQWFVSDDIRNQSLCHRWFWSVFSLIVNKTLEMFGIRVPLKICFHKNIDSWPWYGDWTDGAMVEDRGWVMMMESLSIWLHRIRSEQVHRQLKFTKRFP